MRLWPLVIALVWWTASLGASLAAETSPASSAPASPPQPSSPSGPAHTCFYGVLGEVAHPGVYAAPNFCRLTDLVKQAGGIVPRAKPTVRLFRGGVLTEQMFLGAGEPPTLAANDLIVVGGLSGSPAEPPRTSAVQVAAVQIAFLNLVERPVIVKMPADQATLARIVELLGQPADCAATVRVFSPLGASPRDADEADPAARPLESGTVLVFAPSSISSEKLPALPEAIGTTGAHPASAALPELADHNQSASRLPETIAAEKTAPEKIAPEKTASEKTASEKTAAGAPPAVLQGAAYSQRLRVTAALPVGRERSARPLDIAPHTVVDYMGRPLIQADGTAEDADFGPAFANGPRENQRETHPGRMVALIAAMSAVTGLAMLLTVISIAQRFRDAGKLPFRRNWGKSPHAAAAQFGPAGIPLPPLPTGLSRRPIRIDASQPITRLSVDLAATERTPHSPSAR